MKWLVLIQCEGNPQASGLNNLSLSLWRGKLLGRGCDAIADQKRTEWPQQLNLSEARTSAVNISTDSVKMVKQSVARRLSPFFRLHSSVGRATDF